MSKTELKTIKSWMDLTDHQITELLKALSVFNDWIKLTSEQIEEINKMLSATTEEVIELRKTVDGITRKG